MRRRSFGGALGPWTLGIALTVAPANVAAQATIVDRGTFRLTLAGQEVGTESFTIRQDGTGPAAVTIAQATVALDTGKISQELTSWLRLSPAAGHIAEYRLSVQGGGQERITGTVGGGRFSARIVSPAGEMMREYLASDGAVIIDEGLVHQYYFLAQRAGGTSARVPVLIPRQSRQVMATVTETGSAGLDIGGRHADARHLVISAAGQPERELWVDPRGRVLRFAVPSAGFEATRTTFPG